MVYLERKVAVDYPVYQEIQVRKETQVLLDLLGLLQRKESQEDQDKMVFQDHQGLKAIEDCQVYLGLMDCLVKRDWMGVQAHQDYQVWLVGKGTMAVQAALVFQEFQDGKVNQVVMAFLEEMVKMVCQDDLDLQDLRGRADLEDPQDHLVQLVFQEQKDYRE